MSPLGLLFFLLHLKGADPKAQQAWIEQFPSPSMYSSLLNQPSAMPAVLVRLKLVTAFLPGKQKRNVMFETVLADTLCFGNDSGTLFPYFI